MALGMPLPISTEDLEHYFHELAGERSGVSTFKRTRYGYLYLEAAAGVPDKSSLKDTTKELTVRMLSKSPKIPRQAPQIPSTIWLRLKKAVADAEWLVYCSRVCLAETGNLLGSAPGE